MENNSIEEVIYIMFTVKKEIENFTDVENLVWSGARDAIQEIAEQNRVDEFMALLEMYFADDDNATETELNDFIWFEVADLMHLYTEDSEDEE